MKKIKIDKHKRIIGEIIKKGIINNVKNIRELSTKEREHINYYGNAIMQNKKDKGVNSLSNDELLEYYNVHIPDTYKELEKHKSIPEYNYSFRLKVLKQLENNIKDELKNRNML